MLKISDIFNIGEKLGAVSVPGYANNKRRLAVVAHDGYSITDFYNENKTKVFTTALTVCALSAAMAYTRRKNGTEAIAVWTLISAASGYVAYLSAPIENAAGESQSAIESAKQYLDNRARYLDQTQPGWEQQTINRISSQVGSITR